MAGWKLKSVGSVLKQSRSILLEGAAIWRVWDEAVGPQISARAQPLSFQAGLLWVVVQNAAWMQELQFQAETLMDALNRNVGSAMVREIRFRQGRFSPRKTNTPPAEPDLLESSPPPPETVDSVREYARRIQDPELREIAERIGLRAAARNPGEWDMEKPES
jgi:hypothetical protein